jgi:predicted aldo/keto reductase-like oxidoreductase
LAERPDVPLIGVISRLADQKGFDLISAIIDPLVRFLDVQCIDVYSIHGASWQVWQEAIEPAIGKWLLRARDQGLIQHIGCSCHDSPQNMIKLMDTGFFEAFTVQYNLLDRRNEGAMAHAASRGIGIVVMGPLAGGRVVTSQGAFNSVVPGQDDVTELALRFVLANPNVSLAISGMESLPIIEQNARVAGQDVALTQQQYAALEAHLNRLKAAADLYCSGCNYCRPCPQNVRISQVFSLYNLARVYANWPVARRDYEFILHSPWDPQGRQADACNECGACEDKCPQKIPIRQQLKDAHQALTVKVK